MSLQVTTLGVEEAIMLEFQGNRERHYAKYIPLILFTLDSKLKIPDSLYLLSRRVAIVVPKDHDQSSSRRKVYSAYVSASLFIIKEVKTGTKAWQDPGGSG